MTKKEDFFRNLVYEIFQKVYGKIEALHAV